MIGVIDLSQKDSRSSYNTSNAIIYHTCNGYIYPSGFDSKGGGLKD
jgi:hypothetical protein